MGLFDFIFGKAPKPVGRYHGDFRLLNTYEPKFYRHEGGIYESDLIRAAINARATHISKLKIEVMGAARPALQNKLKHGPNSFQTWSQFLYLLSTRLDVFNTAFIVPVFDEYGEPSGIFCPLPNKCSLVQWGSTPYLRYEFSNGETAAIELSYCGIMTKFQYKSDFFGEDNKALYPIMDLISIQNQGIEEGVKSAATYRFIAQMDNFIKPDDIEKERRRFSEKNFARESRGGGLLLFPNYYKNIQQVTAKPFVVDAEQMRAIKDGIFEYFGVNEDILTNKAFGDAWAAFYEGVVENFAIQFSSVMTKMLFTLREQSQGNAVMATANRLQYMSNQDKLSVTAQLLDRGMLTLNEAREIWNMAPVENGDFRIIRGEYYGADDKITQTEGENNEA